MLNVLYLAVFVTKYSLGDETLGGKISYVNVV